MKGITRQQRTHFVCVCVKSLLTSCLVYTNLPVYFSLGFQGFQLAEFDKTVSFDR